MRAVIAALGVVFIAAFSIPALGDAADAERQASLDSTVRFLQESQQENGGFAQAGEAAQITSAWVALALAAAGINPRNQAQPCGTDAYTYLVENFRQTSAAPAQIATTDLERELLVVNATGTDPHDFAGFDLVGEILARQLPDGSFPFSVGGEGRVNATIYAVLSLSPIEEPAVEPAVRGAANWLIAQQRSDGGWSWQDKNMVSEVDMTGAAIQALNAAGRPNDPAQLSALEAAQREGFAYLKDAQLPDGGFPALPANQRESNVASTSWAVQGIWSAGGDPETWRTGSGFATEEPLDYMESLQQPDGHIRYSRSSDTNGVWMTAYVAPAFAGHALPIPEATFSNASLPPCSDEGGETKTGVIAGGGGKGAPSFSRPKPQSKGRTPGGARIVRNENLRPRNHSKSRRGASVEQSTGTTNREPRGASTQDGDDRAATSSIGSGVGSGPEGPSSNGGAGDSATAETGSGSAEGIPPLSAALRESARSASGGESEGREVSGLVIGDLDAQQDGNLAFGAPGLRSADSQMDQQSWVAATIGGLALLLALGGARWERRHEEALP